jgi:hypothetical protein
MEWKRVFERVATGTAVLMLPLLTYQAVTNQPGAALVWCLTGAVATVQLARMWWASYRSPEAPA